MTHPFRRGFTLIELLIVVAIISILASIALPNFLEAQVRSKVARTKADMRTLMIAIESYRVDNAEVPIRRNRHATSSVRPAIPETEFKSTDLAALTTPIGYMNRATIDIFDLRTPPPNNLIEYFDPTQVMWFINSRKLEGFSRFVQPGEFDYLLLSVAPDGFLGPFDDLYTIVPTPFPLKGTVFFPYDPTNGTMSAGTIFAGPTGGMDQAGQKIFERVASP